MKRLLLIMALSLSAHATVCTNNTYSSHFTCVKMAALIQNTCGTTNTNFINVANTGDAVIVWTDANSAIPSITVTGGGSVSWTALTDGTHSLASQSWNGGAVFDAIWIGYPTATGNLSIKANCSSGGTEMSAFELHSSVGTVAVDCVSPGTNTGTGWTIFTSSANVSNSCTSTKANDFGLSVQDWNNFTPSNGTGWTLMNDHGAAGEFVFEVQAQTSAGTVTGSWTASTADQRILTTIAFSDGSSSGGSGPPPQPSIFVISDLMEPF